MAIKPITISTPQGQRQIGPSLPAFIVAEMSGNHNQSYDRALQLIDAAIDAGVDAIKIQTYTADTMTIDSDKEYFQIKSKNWAGKTLYQLYQEAYTPWEWQPKLKDYIESKGRLFFSAPFDNTAVDFLEKINVSLYKVAGYEIVDIPLLKKIGQTKKPVIMTAAMATPEEIELAAATLRDSGTPALAILHCVYAYPSQPQDMNINTIADIIRRFKVVSGLSDHSLYNIASLGSLLEGGSIIEKHLTLSRADGGPDAAFSLEPAEFKQLVADVRNLEASLGVVSYGPGVNESVNFVFRRSLFVVEEVKQGERFTTKNVRSIRPGHGLAPKYYDDVLGKTAARDIERGTPLAWGLIN